MDEGAGWGMRPCQWCGLLNEPHSKACWWCGLPLDSWPIKRRGAADRPRKLVHYLRMGRDLRGQDGQVPDGGPTSRSCTPTHAARPFHREEVGWGF